MRRSARSFGNRCRSSPTARDIARPPLLQFAETLPAVVPLQRRVIALSQAVAQKLREHLRAALVGQKLDERHALRIEGADGPRIGIVAKLHQLAKAEDLALLPALGQVAQVALDLLPRFRKDRDAFVRPA